MNNKNQQKAKDMPMAQINAPYNFVPLSDVVVFPEWADQVSHDLPFEKGVSGEIEITLTTLSQIVVGSGRDTRKGQPGHLHFFKTPGSGGKFAIPGSSLRGMIRSVFEVATFSKMDRVDDMTFSLRDLTGSEDTNVYRRVLKEKPQVGFLQREGNRPVITPCDSARLDHVQLEKAWEIDPYQRPIFKNQVRKSVAEKYTEWESLCRRSGIENSKILRCKVSAPDGYGHKHVTELGSGRECYPVLTGQVSVELERRGKVSFEPHPEKHRRKHKDFVFFDSGNHGDPIDVHNVDQNAWADFLNIHGENSTEKTSRDMSWPSYWKQHYQDGEKVPVFYIERELSNGKTQLCIGLANMMRLAGAHRTLGLIRNSSDDHLDQSRHDFGSLVFGQVNGEKNNLKGRVFFETAMYTGSEEKTENTQATVLSSAKASYYPNYLEQPAELSEGRYQLKTWKPYNIYADDNDVKIRGWKRYPVRSDEEIEIPPVADKVSEDAKTILSFLPKDSEFNGRIVFHNLRPEELGALFWSIQLEGGRHSIGSGKSFGFGQVKIKALLGNIRPNCSEITVGSIENYLSEFTDYMESKLKKRLKTSWQESEQIQALLAMSKSYLKEYQEEWFGGKFKHMVLTVNPNVNEFAKAKGDKASPGLVLKPFMKPRYSAPETVSHDGIWKDARLQLKKDNGELLAWNDKGERAAVKNGSSLLSHLTLSKRKQKDLGRGSFRKSVRIEGGGKQIRIVEVLEEN